MSYLYVWIGLSLASVLSLHIGFVTFHEMWHAMYFQGIALAVHWFTTPSGGRS